MKHNLKRENNFQSMICPENENKRLGEFFVSLLRALKRFPDKERIIFLSSNLTLFIDMVWTLFQGS